MQNIHWKTYRGSQIFLLANFRTTAYLKLQQSLSENWTFYHKFSVLFPVWCKPCYTEPIDTPQLAIPEANFSASKLFMFSCVQTTSNLKFSAVVLTKGNQSVHCLLKFKTCVWKLFEILFWQVCFSCGFNSYKSKATMILPTQIDHDVITWSALTYHGSPSYLSLSLWAMVIDKN